MRHHLRKLSSALFIHLNVVRIVIKSYLAKIDGKCGQNGASLTTSHAYRSFL